MRVLDADLNATALESLIKDPSHVNDRQRFQRLFMPDALLYHATDLQAAYSILSNGFYAGSYFSFEPWHDFGSHAISFLAAEASSVLVPDIEQIVSSSLGHRLGLRIPYGNKEVCEVFGPNAPFVLFFWQLAERGIEPTAEGAHWLTCDETFKPTSMEMFETITWEERWT